MEGHVSIAIDFPRRRERCRLFTDDDKQFIKSLGLSTRVVNTLIGGGWTKQLLKQAPDRELLATRNLGTLALAEVRRALTKAANPPDDYGPVC